MKQIRRQLQLAAQHEPAHVQPFADLLDKQLRNYGNGNAEDREALRPEIERSVKRIEAARDGR